MADEYAYQDLIAFGNEDANVGVTTLWTKKEEVMKHLDMSKVSAVGQLYSRSEGVNALIRNLLFNKKMRYLFVVGKDLSGSGDAIINFFEKGFSEDRKVYDVDGCTIDEEISIEALTSLRENVKVFDFRDETNYSRLKEKIEDLPEMEAYGESEKFPISLPKVPDRLPSSSSGVVVKSSSVGEAWLEVLKNVITFGSHKKSQYYDDQKELLNMVVVIDDEDPDDPDWKHYYEFTEEDLDRYIPQVLTKNSVEGVEYTYGQRLRDHKGVDQIDEIIKDLKGCLYSRRAIAFTWDVLADYNNPKCPCLDMVQAIVQDDRLHMTVYFRSNDMYGAWPQNCYALRKLQKYIATEVDVEMGTLTTISNSAHIYESNWNRVKEILHDNQEYSLQFDPKGNFMISINDGLIEVKHVCPDGNELEIISGKDAAELRERLVVDMRISDISHALYLGQELAKAEKALRTGEEYVQS